ncbi:MAG: polynucleotide kinase-phosphatase [Bernardetiaceae bacterium]|jgi:protein phosphatase|nr:polynucleotide kinase-phosphatase [Bernardetiaceae bacterium]
MKPLKLPETSLVLLVGPSSAGKSTFARQHFLPTEVISSDYCRALVSDDENNLAATDAAFQVLHFIAEKRLKMGKLTVIDALNLRREDRAKLLQLAKDCYALAAAIVLDTPLRHLLDRHQARPDRNFGRAVLERHHEDLKRTYKSIEREGFSYVYFVKPEEEVEIVRQKLWNNRKEERGGFDIVGDVHGCFDELADLLAKLGYQLTQDAAGHFSAAHPENRRAIFVGDLTDRGEQSPQVLRLVMDLVKTGRAFCVCGNHDDKLAKYLHGKTVKLNHGLDKTALQLAALPQAFRDEVREFVHGLIAHYVLDEGKLVVAHAGLPEEMHGRAAASVRAFCLYGETTGEVDEFGLPVRHPWASRYRGQALVVYGHTPVPEAEWVNHTINIDTGCVFGGKLTALRYPEKELVSVPARRTYCEPVRPALPPSGAAPAPFAGLLEIDIISGKKIIETQTGPKVIVREENATAALEVMSRFALPPQWLIYLPPTMSPPETSARPDYLEHPAEVFAHYHKHGVERVICQEKHMGSRAIAIVGRTPEVAVHRFGLAKPALGALYTRTGRRFFSVDKTEADFLAMLHQALTAAGFWEQFATDWVAFDGELMPWNAKAQELLVKQYAPVGSAGLNGLQHARATVAQAQARGVEMAELSAHLAGRQAQLEKYVATYRRYCRETNGLAGLVYAPFHLLATEGQTYFDQTHPWHLAQMGKICVQDSEHLMVTANLEVDLTNEASQQQAIEWWEALTAQGGEGMVVKPLGYVARHRGRLVQPAMKVRGREYLRIIYGPEYDTPANLQLLKARNVRAKRELAIQEFALGLEGLQRFVAHAPLRRVHECAFGVLALESEAVDPRL